MRERVMKMLGKKKKRGLILSTFHSLGYEMLSRYIQLLGYRLPFILQSPYDLESILNDLMKRRKIDSKKINPTQLLSEISKIKNSSKVHESSDPEMNSILPIIFEDYKNLMLELNSIDFDDLILLPIRLLQNFDEVSHHYHKKFQYLMIDEFQDTNPVQYTFLKLLLGKNQNICVVGDDDQSIYGFRGSDINLILNFSKDFQNTKVVRLLQNYRSSQKILNAANSLIVHNQNRVQKKLWSKINGTIPVEYFETIDERDEAVFVVDQIEKEMLKNKRQRDQIAILFRTNYQSRVFEEELRMRSIPYKLIGGYNFFERKEVRDLIAYIRIVANPGDDVSLLRILNYPKRGIGENTVSKIHKKSVEEQTNLMDILKKICENSEYIEGIKSKTCSVIYEFVNQIEKFRKEIFHAPKMSEVLRKMIVEIGFERELSKEEIDAKVLKARMLNLSELVNMLTYFESEWDKEGKPSLFDFIVRLTLLMSDDESNRENDLKKVQLLTIHLSKGLEYEAVFITGLEEGILPSSKTLDDNFGIDEERRLLYVGMTRAKERLVLTGASQRKRYGESLDSSPSRFLDQISSEYIVKNYLNKGEEDSSSLFLEELEKLKQLT